MGRRRFRGWVMLWALLQFALPTAATYADAALERAGVGRSTAHVESRSSASCQPVHPADCALCHLVHRVGATSAAETCVPEIATRVSAPGESLASVRASPERGRLSLPRAPPVV